MSLFINNIPKPGDLLDFSQGQLLSNNAALDNIFGVDHYKFSNADGIPPAGFHQQVTFLKVGSTPYSVTSTQSYTYQKLLVSNTRSYLEYQPSGPDTFGGMAAVVPLSPKAYIVFVPTTGVITRQFNFGTPSLVGSTYSITFNENMSDAFYTTIIETVKSTPQITNPAVTSQFVSSLNLTLGSGINFYSLISVMVF